MIGYIQENMKLFTNKLSLITTSASEIRGRMIFLYNVVDIFMYRYVLTAINKFLSTPLRHIKKSFSLLFNFLSYLLQGPA